jgi:hypothetical protein
MPVYRNLQSKAGGRLRHLTNSPSDDGWECERGYVAQSAACLALQVPVNGHIDYYGHDWKCNPPLQLGASKNGKNGAKTCQAFILFFSGTLCC